jgi:ectoine hydroxylase-related dioxygenase (phytanoyl-CoA dioxygenase family)
MRTLETSNHLIGDQAALEAQFEKNGYWFFKDVLDIDALKRLRKKYINVLENFGLVKYGNDTLEYTGRSFDAFPGRFKLKDMDAWKSFANNSKIKNFVEEVMGEKIIWIPIVEYRAVRPLGRVPADRFQFWHCDGHFNPGIPYRTIWFPLCDINQEVGGLALRPGLPRGPKLEPDSPAPKTSPEAITFIPHDHELLCESMVATYPYKLGDVIIFDKRTPHSGMHNLSNRFRLSMDIRFVRSSDNVPLIGKLIALAENSIKVKSHDDGHVETLQIDPDAMFRENVTRFPVDAFEKSFPVGTDVIVARQNGIATLVTHLYPPEKTYDDRGPIKETFS